MERLWAFFAENAAAVQAVGSAVQAFFAVVLVTFTAVQLRVASQQRTIADETKKIAVSALGRPYVFLEEITHNINRRWDETATELVFHFRLTNVGSAPAIIKQVRGEAFFSLGPEARSDEKDDVIRSFPEAAHHGAVADQLWRMASALEPHERSAPFILKPGATSGRFRVVAAAKVPPLDTLAGDRLRHWFFVDRHVAPWVQVRVRYEAPFGAGHRTDHCARGRTDGSAETYDKPPYAERT